MQLSVSSAFFSSAAAQGASSFSTASSQAFTVKSNAKDVSPVPTLEATLEKQLQVWKENPTWVDCHPQIEVSVPKGSLCNLNVEFEIGLPPDAVYNILTDPENKRVFKNIKEVMSRKVLIDEGPRQVVEVEQAAAWRFLWWSGVFSVHVLVDQNRKDHTVTFKQGKSGFMERFEGAWKLKPLFVDKHVCLPFEPKTYVDYEKCTGGKGRIGSVVCLQQLIQPTFVPPPPISWYLRGITTKTTEMLIHDLFAEAARIRNADYPNFIDKHKANDLVIHKSKATDGNIKDRWRKQRRTARLRRGHLGYLG
ncbi:hypothetical protein EJ110_NYTH49862 [Nymphaea thermarum]|nr:hypothetical protein EJ110_NYTH49862 [Nymphaea thermarum]